MSRGRDDRDQGGDGYLWDRSGPVDREVADLERMLGGLAHQGSPLRWPDSGGARPDTVQQRNAARREVGRRILRSAWPLLAAALLLVALAVGWQLWRGLGGTAAPQTVVLQPGAPARLIEAGAVARSIRLPQVGELTLDPGSRLRVRRWQDDGALLDLERGRLEAFVYADVRPRFFQVETPAARCVDLGCRYVLSVDDHGAAHVNVTMGYVAFAIADLEVFIPRGAECRAWPARGPGTPRFVDCGAELRAALDGLDRLPRAVAEARRAAGRAVLVASASPRDTLPLYHLLLEPDPVLRHEAEQRLVELVDWPESVRDSKLPRADRGEWLAWLRTMWW